MNYIKAKFVKEDEKFVINASTAGIDRDGEVILPTAFKNLDKYLKTNPVVLFAHDRWKPPVGKAVAGRIMENALQLEIVFAETELGKELRYLYENGFMNAFSVGFIPKKWDVTNNGGRVYTEVELLEVSAVPVPANEAAVVIRGYKEKGIDLPEFEKLYAQTQEPADGEKAGKAEERIEAGSEYKPAVPVKKKLGLKEIKDMTKAELLKAMIAKTEDQEELKKLNDELIEAIREEERAKITKELERQKEESVAKEMKEKAKASEGYAHKIEVGTPGEYKGYNLRLAMEKALEGFRASPTLKAAAQRAMENREGFERLTKTFIDIYDHAVVNKAPMAEGTGAAGGYLVPTEERMELLAYIREASVAMRDCTHVAMATDVMTLPRELTKVSVSYTDEGSEATETTPTFDQVTLTAKRLDAYTIVSNELIQDTKLPGGIVGVLMSQFVEAVGQKIDSTVFVAAGTPVSGVFRSAGYSQVFAPGSTNFSALLEADLRAIISKIPSSRLGNAKWYVHRSPLWTVVYGLKDSQNRPLFIPALNQGAPDLLYGFPVEKPETAPATSAAGTGFIVFGDLRGFWIGDRLTNVNLFVDPYSHSKNYQTVYLLFTRWAFAHALPEYYGRIVTAAA